MTDADDYGDEPARKAGRPKTPLKDILGREDVQAVIAQAAQEAVERALAAQLKGHRDEAGTVSSPDADNSLVRQLAMEFLSVADQDRKVKRVPADEMAAREAAHEKMIDLILRAKANETEVIWEVHGTIFLDFELIQPTYIDRQHRRMRTKIAYIGYPSEAMKPGNAAAQQIYDCYVRWLGEKPEIRGPAARDPNDKLDRLNKNVTVLHKSDIPPEAPHVGKPRGGDVTILGKNAGDDEVVQTRVLGSVVRPARQL